MAQKYVSFAMYVHNNPSTVSFVCVNKTNNVDGMMRELVDPGQGERWWSCTSPRWGPLLLWFGYERLHSWPLNHLALLYILCFPLQLLCKSIDSGLLASAHGRSIGWWASLKGHCVTRAVRSTFLRALFRSARETSVIVQVAHERSRGECVDYLGLGRFRRKTGVVPKR